MRATLRVLACCVATASVFVASVANAATFTVDSNLSSLTLGANLSGTPVLFEQSPGSLTTALGGTLDANFTPGSSIQFLGGGNITFALQAVDPSPGINGVAGTAPANYGGQVNAFGGLETGPAAGRDILAEVTSASLGVAGVAFDASQLTLGVTAGFLDYNLSGLAPAVGRSDISGNSASNGAVGGTATDIAGLQTITIPVSVNIPIDLNGITLTATMSGQIVATRVVPEPGSIAMLGLGLIGLVAVGYRRARKS